jgi:hypothetical protein
MAGYDTNLAAEFLVLSILHRLGADATLTLGNKKSVDIVVVREAGDAVTIDVKGVSRQYDWPADNVRAGLEGRHFLVLVSFEGQIRKPDSMPRMWVVPYKEIGKFMKQYKGRRNISRALILLKCGSAYRDAWDLVLCG